MNRKYEGKSTRLVTTDVKKEKDIFIFSQATWNGLYIINKKTKEIIYTSKFEKEPYNGVMLYYSAQVIGTKVVFSPHSAEHIAIFDYESKLFTYLDIKDCKKGYNENYRSTGKFAESFKYGSFVYMLGYSYPAILKLDIRTLEITYITNWIDEVNKYVKNGDEWGYFSKGYLLQNNKVILPLGCMCGLLELNLMTNDTRLICLPISIKKIGGIASFDLEKIWITPRGKNIDKIVIWDIKNNEYLEKLLPNCFSKYGSYYAPIRIGEKIYIFPEFEGHVYEINEKEMSIKISVELDKILQIKKTSGVISMYLIAPYTDGLNIIFISGWDYKWHIFNSQTGKHYEFSINDNKDIRNHCSYLIKMLSLSEKVLYESQLDLNSFILGINSSKKNHVESSEKIGNKIYMKLCKSN